jgi:hypothetical protein
VKYFTERCVFSDFVIIFAMPMMILLILFGSTKINEIMTWHIPEQHFVAKEFIKNV